jgi:hypothetical protein
MIKTEQLIFKSQSGSARTRSNVACRINRHDDLLQQRGKFLTMEGKNSTVFPIMRIHRRGIRDLIDRRHKQQQTYHTRNYMSEFHRALKQAKTLALTGSTFLRRVAV